MPHPLVSVIIPNYNHAPYLRQRIDSVLQQDYPNLEVILLDDCSTDNSCEILRSYADDSRVSHVVLNDRNTGSTFVQWQRGMDLARGEFVWIAESDDVAHPTLLSTLAGQLTLHPDAAVAYCHSRLIDSEGQMLTEHNSRNPQPNDEGVVVHESIAFLRHMLIFNEIYNASMAVFRRSALDGVDPRYRDYRYCGDWHFWSSVCAQGKVVEVWQMLNDFRQHPAKVTEHAKTDVMKRWRDEQHTVGYIASLCQLTPLQRACWRGRITKRLRAADMPLADKTALRSEFPDQCSGAWWQMLLYEAGKTLFGFLRRRQDIRFLTAF